jgi:isopentenyl-diphosphate Delta-isomerase
MEQIVLLNEEGAAVGVSPKASGHSRNTPLHLAFSCYVFNTSGELLVTRRAWSKKTWPGTWTNSCCGHPAPDEALDTAVHRRLGLELGLAAERACLVVADFRYQARMANDVMENEICPIFRAVVDREPVPNPEEVAEYSWMAWDEFLGRVTRGALQVSPWCFLQVKRLERLGSDPLNWPGADPAALPPAARLATMIG